MRSFRKTVSGIMLALLLMGMLAFSFKTGTVNVEEIKHSPIIANVSTNVGYDHVSTIKFLGLLVFWF